jgi:hypothetical protein
MNIAVSYLILPPVPLAVRTGSISKPAHSRTKKVLLYLPPFGRSRENFGGNQPCRLTLPLALERTAS